MTDNNQSGDWMMEKICFYCVAGVFLLASPLNMAAVLTPEQQLGKQLYSDLSLSINDNQACTSCHMPAAAFADPGNTADPANTPVSPGSITGEFGTRNAPSAAYARFSPSFHWDGEEGLYIGGQFWDGRDASLAGQASRPPLNPAEMALPDEEAVINRLLLNPDYFTAFRNLYGLDLNEASTTHSGVLAAYDRMTRAIGEFEKSREFSEFSSRFDYWLAGKYEMTKQEARGMKLFNGKAKCNLCHLSDAQVAADGSGIIPPLFTDFTYDNLGIPVNPRIAELHGGPMPVDYGLGGRADIAAVDPLVLDNGDVVSAGQAGKFKVMTLRNIAATPPYGHNGFFATLEDIVHFYNTRDVLADCATLPAPETGVNCWPSAEVTRHVNAAELGDLKLTRQQEADLVAFLKTLTDGYGKPLDIILPPAP
jgi:cytochrome c peroxidase